MLRATYKNVIARPHPKILPRDFETTTSDSFMQRQYLLCKMMFVFRLMREFNASKSCANLRPIIRAASTPRHRLVTTLLQRTTSYTRLFTSYFDSTQDIAQFCGVTYFCIPPGSRQNCQYSRPICRRPRKSVYICHWRIGTASEDKPVYLRIKEKKTNCTSIISQWFFQEKKRTSRGTERSGAS